MLSLLKTDQLPGGGLFKQFAGELIVQRIPPHFVRVLRCSFAFTSIEQQRQGTWWERTAQDVFLEARSLEPSPIKR